MIAYHNMPVKDFVANLRDIALKAQARTPVLDMIDAMLDCDPDTHEQDCEEARTLGESDMWDQCFEALKDGLGSDEIGLTEIQIGQVLDIMRMEKP
jgi:hypothetical protein